MSGPSFLGLADAPARNDVQYLLEDEDSHSGGKRMLVAFVLLVIAAGLVYWHWKRDGFPWGDSNSHAAQAPVFSAASSAPAPAEPLPPPATESAHAAAPPTVPSPDESHMTKPDDAPSAPRQPETSPVTPAPSSNTDQQLAAVVPDPEAPPPNSKASESEPPVAPSDADPKAEAPAPKAPAKPSRAVTAKPSPVPAPVLGDDQLVSDGEKYLYGNGVPANCDRAQKNFRTAASHGNARALSMMGTMYATGHCLDRDLPNAYRSFAKALHLEPNNSRIQSDLEILWRQMTPEERQAATHNQ